MNGPLHRDLVLLIKRPFTSTVAVQFTPINDKDNNFNRMKKWKLNHEWAANGSSWHEWNHCVSTIGRHKNLIYYLNLFKRKKNYKIKHTLLLRLDKRFWKFFLSAREEINHFKFLTREIPKRQISRSGKSSRPWYLKLHA